MKDAWRSIRIIAATYCLEWAFHLIPEDRLEYRWITTQLWKRVAEDKGNHILSVNS